MTLGSDGATSIAPTEDASFTSSKIGVHASPALVVFQTPLKDRLVDLGVLVEKDESQGTAPGSASGPGVGASLNTAAAAGNVDRDLLKQLLAAVTKETNDYTEFMLSADAMSGVIPDEVTHLRAAFVASKPHGLTLDRILAGLASSRRVLDGKRNEFER